MPTPSLALPIDVPWRLLAVSPDMMDTRFGNRRFPPAWRTALAIYAYDPPIEDMPAELADQRVTYLKITCTVTGIQPDKEDVDRGRIAFPDVPEEDLGSILEDYLACYGMLLNVAVFPTPSPYPIPALKVELADYPHIIDLQPKTRDLYQSATEAGEVLTGSQSAVGTTKSLISTDSTESGVKFGAEVPIVVDGVPVGKVSGETHRTRTDTDEDQWTVQTDASRERRESRSTSTQLSQMYNLLSGYHTGTNRATFLMLPRPHVLQPTEYRTFAQGLRNMEGIQDFLLITARPLDSTGMCIEARLETGHFPESADVVQPETEYERRTVQFDHEKKVLDAGWGRSRRTESLSTVRSGFEVDGWEFDPTAGTPGRGGIDELQQYPDDNADGSTGGGYSGYSELPAMEGYDYHTASPDRALVDGTIRSRISSDTVFHRQFRVHLRRQTGLSGGPAADISTLLIASRGLNVCLISAEDGVRGDPDAVPPSGPFDWIVDEIQVNLRKSRRLRRTGSPEPPSSRNMLQAIQRAMLASAVRSARSPFGEGRRLIDTDYFARKIRRVMPKRRLETPIGSIDSLPQSARERAGAVTTEDALEMSLAQLSELLAVSEGEALAIRRTLLGIPRAEQDSTAGESS